ncbi:ArsR/SmtB family transcription factor [Paenibacillus silvae]|uniref:ArsR/SmtB family transcription factor n=1 Tax=Paenibacillus silvae TaxID=1325358 RepID=UPI00119F68BB|nr:MULTISPECIES: helix-turn-helix transcriptional regulator [Paenibacillus]MCK6074828.1 ArsR family transcriptional regulator [Paenibacillus silvae]MCK6147697.1 ArsR family transcriptional regulator [Paenibacillus silvae]MCK6265995.1 ArsR family transcriptional regulator [Paenibacillus silvae]
MNAYPNITVIASLIADTSRSIFLAALLDGRALPAGELAYMAGVSPQTASNHLAKLVAGGLLQVEQQGRHRYYRLASQEIADLIEKMASIAPPAQIRSLKQSSQLQQLSHARTCYDHLAGKLGTSLCEALLESGYLVEPNEPQSKDYLITEKGSQWLSSFGIKLQSKPGSRRAIARKCLDWSERRHHLSGLLGEQLFQRLLELNWIRQKPGSRSIEVTETGKSGLYEVLEISL